MKAGTRRVGLPTGYEVREETKRIRVTFALMPSVVDGLKEIAERKGITRNALVNDILRNYVKEKEAE